MPTAAIIARHGAPRSLDDLAGHDIIGFDRDTSTLRALARGLPITREMFALRTDDSAAQLAALRAGFGIGACQTGIAARNPDLVPVLAGTVGFKLEMWLVMHEDLKGSRRVRLLFDHLAARFEGLCGGRLEGVDSPRAMAYIRAPFGAAGWSSPVARQAHNLKVTGSNPVPATNVST